MHAEETTPVPLSNLYPTFVFTNITFLWAEFISNLFPIKVGVFSHTIAEALKSWNTFKKQKIKMCLQKFLTKLTCSAMTAATSRVSGH